MVVSEIRLYELLKAKLGSAEAEAFVELLDSKVETKFEEKQDVLATKADISNLRAELLRTIYLVSVGQLIAIVGSVMALVSLLK